MVMRIVIIVVLALALNGCLKKQGNEAVVPEPISAIETANVTVKDAPQEVSGVTEKASFEKPSGQDIQKALANANLYDGKIDGVLGSKTKKAIKDFQSQNGLKADGKVGPMTWEKLKEHLNKAAK